jgi:hypothetical protein
MIRVENLVFTYAHGSAPAVIGLWVLMKSGLVWPYLPDGFAVVVIYLIALLARFRQVMARLSA